MLTSSPVKAPSRLPTAPGVALRIINLCRRDDTQIYEIAEIIMLDAALTARLLRYANSSAVGVGRKVTSVRDAVLLMGLRSTELLALGFSLLSPDFRPSCPEFELNRFWAESFLTATVARKIAGTFQGVDREEAFVAGLLSRIGQLALACTSPKQYSEVLRAAEENVSITEAEVQQFGVDHFEFGTKLLADWRFPSTLVEALREQSQLPTSTETPPSLGTIAHTARQLVPALLADPRQSEQPNTAWMAVRDLLDSDEEGLQNLVGNIVQEYREVADVFELSLDDHPALVNLLSEAREEAIRIGIAAHLEQSRLYESHSVLLQQASTDPLTGVANRAKLEEELKRVLAEAARGQADFGLILFDLDHFKKVNDTYGHPAGDFVLKEIARIVREMLREVDLLARYGGEEFAVVLPGTDANGACLVTERIRDTIEKTRLNFEGTQLSIRVSLGLVLSTDYAKIPTQDQLISDADAQLYLSKNAGRNIWHFRDKPTSNWRGRLRWNYLSKALVRAFGQKHS
jgi:diguanylate cyclase (GGDEF)-like protein